MGLLLHIFCEKGVLCLGRNMMYVLYIYIYIYIYMYIYTYTHIHSAVRTFVTSRYQYRMSDVTRHSFTSPPLITHPFAT